jgi:hypothetical protein
LTNTLGSNTLDELNFFEAIYPLQLDLPTGHKNSLADAGQSVMAEFRDSVKWWMRLQGGSSWLGLIQNTLQPLGRFTFALLNF